MNSLKKLLVGLEKRFKVSAFVAPVLIMGEVLLEVLIPLIMARIIDVGITNHDVGFVVKYGLIMILAALASLGFGVFAGKYAAVASVGFARNIRRRLFYKIQDFSFGNVDKFSTSSLVTRLTTDVTNTQNTFQMIIRMCVRAPFMFVSAIIMSFYINSKMALIFIAAIPLIAIPAGIIMKKAFPRFQEMMKNYDSLNGAVQENLIGIRAVKAFVREKDEIKRFEIAANAVRTTQIKAEKLVILNMPIMQLVMYLSIIAILWFGGNFIIAGSMQMGELISFITYLTQILMSLMMISMIFVMLVISKASISRIVEVLDEEVDIKSPVDVKTDAEMVKDGSIRFKNVFFSYDNQESTAVLRNINMEIESGMTVGIVGGTGSSKTTLVQLIPRLYDSLSGDIEVGGVNVKDYNLETLRNSVAMVLQKNVLFSGSIKDNLRWGNAGATDEEIFEACKAASAHDFISSFPNGYETELGQGGVNLSGGQKQRLCIARALLKQPKILILDDSTSAVDTATDASIRKSLSSTLENTTKIIIAQRISSIQDADVIYVLDEGEIVDFGKHEKLLETCEIYREVYESQLKGNDFDEEV
jgi:ATP-binding cassette subfamily B protein